jgi:hypothetical protein
VGIIGQENKRLERIPINLRWLAIAAGCSCGLAGSLLYGPLFLIFPSIQILGAVVESYLPRFGRVLLVIGACILTVYSTLFLASQALGGISVLRVRNDLAHVALFLLLIVSLASLVWSDIALVLFVIRPRKIVRME